MNNLIRHKSEEKKAVTLLFCLRFSSTQYAYQLQPHGDSDAVDTFVNWA
jgi:hypothetical protein